MSLTTVSWPERIVFVALCVVTSATPVVAHLAIHALPGEALVDRWYDNGVYLSWAFLIYFSWACLPRLSLPARQRAVAWVSFFALELAYPVVSWLLEGGTRLHVYADVASYFSSSLAFAAGGLLLWAGGAMVRKGEWFILLPLAFVAFFVVWPGLSVEWDWWAVVELPHGDVLSQALRGLGVVAGTTGVLRNLLASDVFG
jgi:hypothetical protein